MKKETKKNVIAYVLSNLSIYGASIIFSLFSLIFFIDKIHKAIKFIVSFVFIAPIFYMVFAQGRTAGDKLFKTHVKAGFSDIHNEEGLDLPYYKCIYHVIGFVVPIILLLIISVATSSIYVRLVPLFFEFPIALLFSSVGVLDTRVVTPMTLAVFIPYTLLEAGMFVLGYLLKIRALKRQYADIQNELRTFDN